jgi:hypothetical protein
MFKLLRPISTAVSILALSAGTVYASDASSSEHSLHSSQNSIQSPAAAVDAIALNQEDFDGRLQLLEIRQQYADRFEAERQAAAEPRTVLLPEEGTDAQPVELVQVNPANPIYRTIIEGDNPAGSAFQFANLSKDMQRHFANYLLDQPTIKAFRQACPGTRDLIDFRGQMNRRGVFHLRHLELHEHIRNQAALMTLINELTPQPQLVRDLSIYRRGLLRCDAVNANIVRYVDNRFPNQQVFNISGGHETIDNTMLAEYFAARQRPKLIHVHLSHCDVTQDTLLIILANCPNLQVLSFEDCQHINSRTRRFRAFEAQCREKYPNVRIYMGTPDGNEEQDGE